MPAAAPGTLAAAQTNARAISGARAHGVTLIPIGDSITASGTDAAAGVQSDSWITYMALAAGGRVRIPRNSAIGGQRAINMLPRFQADVMAYKPSAVVIATGTNESTLTGPDGLVQCVESMIRTALAAGCAVALATAPARDTGPGVGPSGIVATATAGGGGTLPAGTYDYMVLYRSTSGVTLPLPSNGSVVTITTPSTGSVTLRWTRLSCGSYQQLIFRRVSGVGNFQVIGGSGTGYGRTDSDPYFVDTGLAADGALPPTVDQPGSGNSSGTHVTTAQRATLLNTIKAMHYLAQKYGLPLVNLYELSVDPATGWYKQGIALGDGVHPSSITQKAFGVAAWNQIRTILPEYSPILANDPADLYGGILPPYPDIQNTTVINGAFLPGNAPSMPSTTKQPQGWSKTGSTTSTFLLGPTTGIPGNTLAIASVDNGVSTFFGTTVSSTDAVNYPSGLISAGDRIRVAFRFKTSGMDANGGQVSFSALFSTAAVNSTVFKLNLTSDWIDWTIWETEGIAPVGVGSFTFNLSVQGYQVNLSIAQVTITNLTRLGVAT